MINYRLLSAAVLLALAATAAAQKCPSIDNFVQVSETETSVVVSWDVNEAEDPVLKYRLTINSLLTQEFLCSTTECTYTVNNLQACNVYALNLVAICEGLVEGPPGDLDANTAYVAPGGVGPLTDDGTVVSWTEPTNAVCVGYYEVCYTSSFLLQTICVDEASTTFDYTSQVTTGCDELIISVKATTPDGQQGPPSTIEVVSDYGVPGKVRNYEVSFTSDTDIILLWDNPTENPGCIKDFSIIYGPEDQQKEQIVLGNTMRQEHEATLTNLNLCSLYLVQVSAVSVQDEMGPPAIEYMQTKEEPPELIPNIEADPDTDSIEITWGDGMPDSCLSTIKICVSDPVTATHTCDEIDNIGTGYGNYTVTGLSPCRGYTFVIEGVSPGGLTGPVYSNTTFTEDVAPGPVRNLAVDDVTEAAVLISWDEPLEHPECVNEYVITYINTFESVSKSRIVPVDEDSNGLLRADFNDALSGLSSCVDYRIEVYGVSASGFAAPLRDVMTTTLTKDPGDVRNLEFIEATTDSVTVVWYAPDDKYCVHHYNVEFDDEAGTIIEDAYTPPDSSANQFVHTFRPAGGLAPCTFYKMRMDAYQPEFPDPTYVTIDVMTNC